VFIFSFVVFRLINCELALGHYREARWIYYQLIQTQPFDVDIWHQFLMFELAGVTRGYSSHSLIENLLHISQQYDIQLTNCL
jgi:hypothetical protein